MLNGCLVNRHTLEIRRLSPTSFFSSPRERSIRSRCASIVAYNLACKGNAGIAISIERNRVAATETNSFVIEFKILKTEILFMFSFSFDVL